MNASKHKLQLALSLIVGLTACDDAVRSLGSVDGDPSDAEKESEGDTGEPSVECPDEQIWEGDFHHSTHDVADLDGYTEVTGNIEIQDTTASALQNLQCLRRVGGKLWIGVSHDVVDLDMLDSLEYVGTELQLDIHDNLENVDGLSNLTHATALELDLNPKLTDISGLANVATTLEQISINRSGIVSLAPLQGLGSTGPLGLVQFQENPDLVDLSGLSEVTEIDALNLHFNDSLESLRGLENLEVCHADFEIGPHPRLRDLNPVDPRIDGSLQHIGNGFFHDNEILPTCAVEYLVDGIEVADRVENTGQLDCACDGPVCQ
jgi:hypothetical protein